MAVATVLTREQFQIRSEMEIVHLPTGAVFHAYPYSDPRDLLQSMRVNWGRHGAPTDIEFSEKVRRSAAQLLLEQTRRVAADRQLSQVA
jgi:hypothetical protein